MCADLAPVSLQAWSRPCRLCGQCLLILPDRASPTTETERGTICFECWPDFVTEKLSTQKRWDAQYNALLIASSAGLPKATIARIALILLEGERPSDVLPPGEGRG